jgi:hypothetical protein
MFVSIIFHSKIRQKGFYYHGWDEKIYRKSDAREIAYTPEINGIPNLLEATPPPFKHRSSRRLHRSSVAAADTSIVTASKIYPDSLTRSAYASLLSPRP